MAEAVYVLCAITSFLCAWLLYRSYWKSGARLLLWSSCCFFFFLLNNIMVIVDLVLTGKNVDLSIYRILPALLGVMVMIYGFVWDVDSK
jgi:hypothetical protein